MHVLSTKTFTRPANATAYTVGDIVGVTPGAALEFTNIAWHEGLSGTIISAKLAKSGTTTTNAVFRLYIYTSAPTVGDDNSAANILWSQVPGLVGVVDFYLLQSETAGASQAMIENIQYAFKCAETTDSLFGVLIAEAAYTPASAEQFELTLGIDRD